MVKKLHKMSADRKTGPQLASAVKDSAQQIWLAGLGAFSKAQEEGSKVFDALVKEGQSIQRKTQAAAEEKITETTSRMSDMASDFQSRAGNRWDKLETIFEERVVKALGKLGVPLAKDVQALADRVEQLSQQLQEMSGSGGKGVHHGNGAASAPKARPARKTSARTTTPTTSRAAAKRASQTTAPSNKAVSPAAAAKRPAARKTVRSAAAASQAAHPKARTATADDAT